MEFRKMRRNRQQLNLAECEEILDRNMSGVLSVLGDNGYPYAVPLSYIYLDGKLYFHCAKQGHKLDAIKSCPKVSFCIIDQDLIVPREYTTYFRSVILFGKAKIMEDETEIRYAADKLAEKYAPEDTETNRKNTIEKESARLCMVQIEIEHITGKAAKELMEN